VHRTIHSTLIGPPHWASAGAPHRHHPHTSTSQSRSTFLVHPIGIPYRHSRSILCPLSSYTRSASPTPIQLTFPTIHSEPGIRYRRSRIIAHINCAGPRIWGVHAIQSHCISLLRSTRSVSFPHTFSTFEHMGYRELDGTCTVRSIPYSSACPTAPAPVHHTVIPYRHSRSILCRLSSYTIHYHHPHIHPTVSVDFPRTPFTIIIHTSAPHTRSTFPVHDPVPSFTSPDL
jgi:hypothetical protein